MPVPDELAAVTSYPVTGRRGLMPGRNLRFGPFEARDLDRSRTQESERGRDVYGRRTTESQITENYAFGFYDGGREVWRVRCQTRAHVTQGSDRTILRTVVGVQCMFTVPGTTEPAWRLTLYAGRPPTGQMVGGPRRFRLEGTYELQGSPIKFGDASGYYVMEGIRVLAMVEVLNDGLVRLATGLAPVESDAIAGAASAILLFDDLSRAIDQLQPGN